MSKMVATKEAVRVKIAKSEIINNGAGALDSAWNVLEMIKHREYPDRAVRDVQFSHENDDLIITLYLAEVKETEDEDTTRNSEG